MSKSCIAIVTSEWSCLNMKALLGGVEERYHKESLLWKEHVSPMQSFLEKVISTAGRKISHSKSNVKISINGLRADVNVTLLRQFFFEVLLPFIGEQGEAAICEWCVKYVFNLYLQCYCGKAVISTDIWLFCIAMYSSNVLYFQILERKGRKIWIKRRLKSETLNENRSSICLWPKLENSEGTERWGMKMNM